MEQKLYSDRQLIRLLVPLLVETVLNILVGMMDTVMVSSLGDAAVSGVSLVDQICAVLINMMSAMATGGAVVAAQLMGARRREDACRVTNQLILVTVGAALLIMIPLLSWSRGILELIFSGIEADVMRSALTYLKITALSYPFLALMNAGAAIYRTMNRSKVTMLFSMLANAINVGGNALCIYVFKMGVEGVAIPTLAARAAAGIGMLVLLRNGNLELHIIRREWKPRLSMVKEIARIGLPNGFENSLFQLGRLLVVRIIAAFGTVQIAANAVAYTLDTVGIIAGTAVNLGLITVVGKCVGAGDYPQARYYTRKLMLWTYIATAVLNGTMLALLKPLLGLFAVSDETLKLAYILVFIHNGLSIFLWPLSFTLPNTLRAAGDVRYTMVVSIVSMAVFRVLLSYLIGLHMGLGAIGVWICMIIDWLCRITCFTIRYKGTEWEHKANIRKV